MIQIRDTGRRGYHPDMEGDPLAVEKGCSHFRQKGQKDFLSRMLSYEHEKEGVAIEAETFRGRKARVVITFADETVFCFQMFPEGVDSSCLNEVFSFGGYSGVTLLEEEEAFLVKTGRVTLRLLKCPWEMTVLLDGRELTKEQIKDHNVDQKYKAVPVGFTVDESGRVTDAFETMYLYSDEAFYGFGEKFTEWNKRGQKIKVWQRDANSTNSDSSYKGMPYFMSSMGYSILLNTYTRTHFNMGASSGVSYTMETEDPYLDYYMFCNRDYKGLIRDYTALSGRSPMIPRWAFGFWMSRMSYRNRREVEQIVDKMNDFGMSSDVIHIDGWLDMMSGTEGSGELLSFDENRFPDPEGMIKGLGEKGIHLSLWMFPYVPPQNMVGESSYAGESRLFQNMKDRGYLVRDSQGEPYIFALGEGTGASVAALDFTNPDLTAYMKERVKRLMKLGVGVIKTDFSEEIPEDAVFYDGSTGLMGHNKYTLLYARTIYEASREAKEEMGEKALLWGRSGYAGSQNYPANWAGDSSAATNNLAAILRGGLSIGVSGVSFWGFDIGGFYNSDDEGNRAMPSDEEYIRSVQMGLLSPLSRSHGQATPREPWEYSSEAQAAFLKIDKLRYRLLPYLYSTAYESHYEGIPMMRAMLLEFMEDLNTRDISNQYMLGEALLTAPVFDQQKHHIYLPEGQWLDLDSGEILNGGGWIEYPIRLDVIPLFLRFNRMLPMLKEAPMHIAEQNFGKLEILLAISDKVTQRYYDDGIKGIFQAELVEKTLIIHMTQMDVETIRVYSKRKIENAQINGTEYPFTAEGKCLIIQRKRGGKVDSVTG